MASERLIPVSCVSASLECGVCYEQYDDMHHKPYIMNSVEIDELTQLFNLQLCDLQEQQEQIEYLTDQLKRVQRDVANSRKAYTSDVEYYKSACAELNRRLDAARAEKQVAHAELIEMRMLNEKQRASQRATRTAVTRRPRWLP
jgi:t-SNARE complex subunit (syntaxin)